jgi:flagellar biosynthesis GTPase FlhF
LPLLAPVRRHARLAALTSVIAMALVAALVTSADSTPGSERPETVQAAAGTDIKLVLLADDAREADRAAFPPVDHDSPLAHEVAEKERQEEQERLAAERAAAEAEAKAQAEEAARRAEEEARARAEAEQQQREQQQQQQQEQQAASNADGGVWDRLAQCESGGNWSINTGNGYYGGLQFNLQTWRSVGGSGYPHQASKAEQIHRAQILHSQRGFQPWPACSSKLGLR